MALRANVLAKGFSGIRVETLEALLALLNRGVHPRVPSRGSVGASGDLAPLAHLALVLIGEGEADVGRAAAREPAAAALRRAGLAPVTLGAEGRAGAHQRHAGLDGRAGAGAGRRGAPGAGRRHRRGAVASTRCSARAARSNRASTTPRPFAGTGGGGRQPAAAARRQRDQRVARQLRPRAGRLLDALRAAGARRGARSADWIRHIVDGGDERRDRQPDGVRR